MDCKKKGERSTNTTIHFDTVTNPNQLFQTFFGFRSDNWNPSLFPDDARRCLTYNSDTNALVVFNSFTKTNVSLPIGKRTQEKLMDKRNRVLKRCSSLSKEGSFTILCGKDVGELVVKWPSATFQLASQYNALEMSDPKQRPCDGVRGYFHDNTQGPRVALTTLPDTMYILCYSSNI